MKALVLHLSDIHIKTSTDPILQRGNDIGASTFPFLRSASHIFIVVSGDIAYSGVKDEYNLADQFLTAISEKIRNETECPIDFLLVPGNHDCDFKKNFGARNLIVKSLEGQETVEVDDSIIDTCTSIQNDFFDFRNCIEDRPGTTDDKLWRTSRFEIEGKILSFDCLNVSWVSKLKEDPGRLFFTVSRYSNKVFESADVRFVVIHHPLNWFNQNTYRQFRMFIRKLAHIVISGHEHQGNVGLISDVETDNSAFIEGFVLQNETSLADSAFNIVILDLTRGQFASTHFSWDGTRYVAREEGSWSDYRNLPAKISNPFAIAQNFLEILEDPGAYFKHPGRSYIGLSDIYVYPDLLHVNNENDRRREFINASKLLSPELTANGVLIEAEEKAGGTSLLYQIYRYYHYREFVPVLIKGKDLKRVSDSDVDTLIKRAIESQYGKDNAVLFEQLPKSKKVLLLDDFDDSSIRSAGARVGLLSYFRKCFGYFLVTVGDMFEMREMLDGDISHTLTTLEHYILQPFGHVLRGQLIARWLSLAEDGTIDNATFIARRDQAERLMNSVMQKGIIPSSPLFLLTLLQSIDAGRSGDFKESALGYYYQYLLTEAFQNSGVKPDKLTEHFQYTAYLAWEFHTQNKMELSEIELRDFNERYSKQWHTVDFKTRLEVLLKSRIICKFGDDYSFRYPYIYYYLKGHYLSENLTEPRIRSYIVRCCKHLYVRDYANTVLFLGHHTNDNFVLQSIAESLHNLFNMQSPILFYGDTKEIGELINDAPKLTYSEETPTEHRNRINAAEDEIENGNDGLSETEEGAEELSLIAQMTTLFKTTEILGQILKNQYSKILRDRKGELLDGLFNGPLRAISHFYDFLKKNPDALVAEIDAALRHKTKIKDENERKKIARKAVARLAQIITFSFIMRASQSASSSSLAEDVHDVVKKNGSPAYDLIELGILLDSPKPIPRQKLLLLHEKVKTDIVAYSIIQFMVLNRLYMFVTSEQDMQWLQEKLGIDLGIQHAITYQEKRGRQIK